MVFLVRWPYSRVSDREVSLPEEAGSALVLPLRPKDVPCSLLPEALLRAGAEALIVAFLRIVAVACRGRSAPEEEE